MTNDNESQWLRTRMDRMRERRGQSIPSFDRIWEAAKDQRTGSDHGASPRVRGLAFASWATALILAVAAAGYWGFGKRQQSERRQLEFAAMEGALVTYWQAPSDALLETVSGTEPAER